MSYYTGTPNISIPIYNIAEGSIQIPISLSYHASGIKVSDQASWTGTGWSLQAGGMISRVMRGIRDEDPLYGFFVVGSKIADPDNRYSGQFLSDASKGKTDTESDVYFLNLPGLSTKFFFDYNKQIYLVDYQDILIESPFTTGHNYWRVVGPDGTQYYLGKMTASESSGEDLLNGETDVTASWQDGGPTSQGFTSAWHLLKIVSADQQDVVRFYYDNEENISTESLPSETLTIPVIQVENPLARYCLENPTYTPSPNGTITNNFQKLLSKISFSHGSVEFVPSITERLDLLGAHSLDRIYIKNSKGDTLKYFGLQYGNFQSSNNKRLKLQRVIEYSKNNNPLPPYELGYNETVQLPSQASYKQDHWGYYNNNNKESLIPRIIKKLDGSYLYFDKGGNRDTDPVNTLANMLTSITYPTGGKTTFDYEAHEIARVGMRQATEYYPEPHPLGCPEPGHEDDLDCSREITLTVDGIYTAHIVTNVNSSDPSGNGTASVWSHGSDGDRSLVSSHIENDTGSDPNEDYIILDPAHTYTLSTSVERTTTSKRIAARVTFDIYKTRNVTLDSEPIYVGGARIHKITNYDIDGKILKKVLFSYKYKNNDDQLISSGILVKEPLYYYQNQQTKALLVRNVVVSTLCIFDQAFSSVRNSLGEGSHVGYKEVVVTEDEAGSTGSNIFKYVAADEEPDAGGQHFPFAPADSRDNRRGKLKEQVVLNAQGDTLQVTQNEYSNRNEHRALAVNWKVGQYTIVPGVLDTELTANAFKIADYYNQQEWSYLSRQTVKTYDGANILEKVTEYNYDRPDHHVQLTSTESTGSDGASTRTYLKYPTDYEYTTDTQLAGHQALISNHVLNPVVEEQTWVDNYLVHAKATQFHNTLFHPINIWLLESPKPKSALNKEGAAGGKYSYLLSDSSFVLKANLTYFGGRLRQVTTPDATKSYQWDSRNMPVAQAINTKYTDFLYNGFEDGDGDSADGDSKTGHKSKTNYTASLSNLTNGTYRLTYWKKDNGVWTLQASTVDVTNNSYTLNITGQVDDVRFYPKDAAMTTFTYDEMTGQTSQTNVANVVQYFDFDDFLRLSNMRDNDRNITKNYHYNYFTSASAGQSTLEQWVDTGNKRCVFGSSGPTGDQEKEQTDTNPLSATYSQLRWVDNGRDTGQCQPCLGSNKKWINGQCETGSYIFLDVYELNGKCITEYQYSFSDGTSSPVLKQSSNPPCQF
ncbi:hypothetical protein [Chryseolinea soli]|uniref:RHS repeat protein n=1 Tax=Chryseolinea soli TaxID=2321403 RepID=A0A385SZU7_9BACT|nr:hypothetical protein [Chryseolinea soli]AYB34308.1 hypothetical protein D4L85_28675 [Chryseolinea soli]